MSNIATTIEQSKHLLELGIGSKSADMCLCKTEHDTWFLCAYIPGEYDAHTVPAWSLSALLEVMPAGADLYKMQDETRTDHYYEVECCGPIKWVGFNDKDPITATYEMVCWLLEQGLIKKGGKQ